MKEANEIVDKLINAAWEAGQHSGSAVYAISTKAIADRITEIVLKGNEVEMIITEHGIKFCKIGGSTNDR